LDIGAVARGGNREGGKGADQQDAQTHEKHQLKRDSEKEEKHSGSATDTFCLSDQQSAYSDRHLRNDAALVDLLVDERGAYEADEAAHSGAGQAQNGFHWRERKGEEEQRDHLVVL